MLKKTLVRLLDGDCSSTSLSPFGGSNGLSDWGTMIREGANIIGTQFRAPDATRFIHREPMDGVPIIQREQDFMPIVATIVAASIHENQWMQHQFYYYARLPDVRQSGAWRYLEQGLSPHGLSPVLARSDEIWVFAGRDFWLAEIMIKLGTSNTRSQLVGRY